jgi:hypothetical protein
MDFAVSSTQPVRISEARDAAEQAKLLTESYSAEEAAAVMKDAAS